ncbi:MAG: hypothetical protein JNL58_12985 [Planctomyces sp.]|nr:hypothetical protein [Planctomyces sp.]
MLNQKLALASLVFCGFAFCSIAGCGGSTNTHCPVMGNEVVPDLTVQWNGKTVAFCCPPCLDEWEKMTDEERQKALDNPPAGQHHE